MNSGKNFFSSRRKGLWQGLCCIFAALLAVSIIAATVLEANRTAVDRFLETTSEVVESSDDGTLFSAYTPTEDVLNTDGTGNSSKLILKAMDIGRRESQEGSVLLKNNGALPLSSGNKVTLLGIRSAVPLLGSQAGVLVKDGQTIDLATALSGSRTAFTGLENFDFDGAGLEVNPVMLDVYNTLNQTLGLTQHDQIASAVDNVSRPFNPNEPSLDDLAAADSDYQDSFAEYGDAAIVVVGRPSTENQDYLPGWVGESEDVKNGNSTVGSRVTDNLGAEEPLQLTRNERDIIELAKDRFDKVIVLVNTNSTMEIDALEEDPEIDSVLWIGHPGAYGMPGVGDILVGKANPSGGLSDIYAANNLSHPAMMNMGWYRFANMSRGSNPEITRESQYSDNYLIEAEGIYVGYRYFETRYNDVVIQEGNAASSAGVYESQGTWNYGDEVTYSFGYGMSYTQFEQEITDIEIEQLPHEIYAHITVQVTNTGDVAGRTSVQIYGQAPYEHGVTTVEKAAIQLLAFDKTDVIQPGEDATIEIEVDLANLASYDNTVENNDGTTGTYIFEDGEYYFALGYDNENHVTGAHAALNNVLAQQGYSPANTDGRMDSAGDIDCVRVWEYDYAGSGTDTSTFGISKNGVRVSNQLDYADFNYFADGTVTYLSRNDWERTYPVTYGVQENRENNTQPNETTFEAPDSMLDLLNGNYYTVKTDQDTSGFTWGSTDTDVKFYQMQGASWDDPRWDDLLSQMTREEAWVLAANAGDSIPSVESAGLHEQKITVNAGNGLDEITLGSTLVANAPWAISADDPNAGWYGICFASSPVLASTFNPGFMHELGEFIGIESLFVGIPVLWGPGLNTHRTPYGGRNGEYYSEDPVLSGVAAMEYAIGAREYGLIVAPKHFAFNDQETKRKGLAPFMTEQRAREIELRAYQIPIEATKYDRLAGEDTGMLGLMISFSKIGPVECTASRGLLTDILCEEWGFRGYATTDIFDDPNLFSAVVYAGATGFDFRGKSNIDMTIFDATSIYGGVPANQIDGTKITTSLYDGDADMMQAIKDSNKRTFYVLANSNLMNSYNSTSHTVSLMTWWRAAYISLITVTAVLAAGSAAMYAVAAIKSTKEES